MLDKCYENIGRGAYDPVILMKILLLQKWYNLSDHAVVAEAADRKVTEGCITIVDATLVEAYTRPKSEDPSHLERLDPGAQITYRRPYADMPAYPIVISSANSPIGTRVNAMRSFNNIVFKITFSRFNQSDFLFAYAVGTGQQRTYSTAGNARPPFSAGYFLK